MIIISSHPVSGGFRRRTLKGAKDSQNTFDNTTNTLLKKLVGKVSHGQVSIKYVQKGKEGVLSIRSYRTVVMLLIYLDAI